MAFIPDSDTGEASGHFVPDSGEQSGGSILDTVKNGIGSVVDDISSGLERRKQKERDEAISRSNVAAQTILDKQNRSGTDQELQAMAAADDNQRRALNNPVQTGIDLVRDTGVMGVRGIAQVGQAGAGLAGMAVQGILPGNPMASDLALIQKGFSDFDKGAAGFLSDTGVAKEAKMESARGFTETLLTLGTDPRLMYQEIVKSLPGMFAAGKIGEAAVGIYGRKFAAEAGKLGLTGEAAQQYVVKAFAENADKITRVAMLGSAAGEGLQQTGQLAGNAQEANIPFKDYVVPAVASGVLDAAISLGSNKLANKIGIGDVETDIALRKTGVNTGKTGSAFVVNRAAIEGLKEGLFEEMPQSTQEAIMENIALSRPWDQGIGKAAAAGLAAGFGMGGGHALVSRGGGDEVSPATPMVSQEYATPATDILGSVETSAAEKALYTPKSLTALDRVNEIDALVAESPEEAAALLAERDEITKTWPQAVAGTSTSFSTESGARVDANYALMDAGDLVTSHDENLRPTQNYPTELQPRERERHASEIQVSSIVQKLDPARLGLSADAATGAPIIGADGLVESGNARTIALKRIYQANGQKAVDYKQFLRGNAEQFGIMPESVDAISKPVLVRVRTTPVNRAEFARQANASTVAQMSPGETAKSDAARMDVMDDLRPDENGDFSTSRDFIRRFMSTLPSTEQGGMMDSAGQLSQSGYARIRNAILAKAYGDSPVLSRMVESMDDSLRNVGKALVAAAPAVAKTRQSVAEGALFDADITPDLMAAVEELSRIKESGQSISEALAQAGMFGDRYSAETRALIQFLADNLRRPRVMTEFIQAYMEALTAAGNPNQGSIFGETTVPKKSDLINVAKGNDNGRIAEDAIRGEPAKAERAGDENGEQSADAQSGGGGTQSDEAANHETGSESPSGTELSEKAEAKEAPKKDVSPSARMPASFEPKVLEFEQNGKPKKSKATSSIEDFGEKLGGAKKDVARSVKESLSKEFSDEELVSQPLSKVWPKPDIDVIENQFVAAFAYAARNEIPAKPKNGYKLKRWLGNIKALRSLVSHVLNLPEERVRDIALKDHLIAQMFMPKVDLLAQIDRGLWNRVGKVSEYPDSYAYNKEGEQVKTPHIVVEIDGKNQWIVGKSVAEVIDQVSGLLGGEALAKKMQFEVRGRGGVFAINKKGDKEYRKLKTFTSTKEAFDFIKNNYDDLAVEWEKVKERDNVKETDVRGEENRPRTGQDWRKGKDVTPEEFSSQFGFRGVEFGNWVTQGKNAKERQGMINQAYDALMDLANIVDVPPKAISLNGSLGLGFGSRGSGSASAHFEPGTLVINLTKTRGAGTLAHEWFHALDNYFSRQRGGESKFTGDQNEYRQNNYITYKPEPMFVHKTQRSTPTSKARLEQLRVTNPNAPYLKAENWQIDPNHPQGVRPVVETAFADLVKALDDSPMSKRSKLNDKAGDGYWSRIIERSARSFENYVISKMMENGYNNDYLANVRSVADFPRSKERYPYLLPEEIAPIATAFDNLFSTLQTEKTDQGIALYQESAVYNVNEPDGISGDLFQGTEYEILPENKRENLRRKRTPAQGITDSEATPSRVLAVREAKDEPGVYYVTAQLVTVGERALPVDFVRSAQDAAQAFAHLSHYAVEHLDGLVTDKDGKPLAIIGSFKGSPAQSPLYPSTLMMELARIDGAANLWLSHNHPSGRAELSSADRRLSESFRALLHGTNIAYRGLSAIAGRGDVVNWADSSYNNGVVTLDPTPQYRVPIVEREIVSSSPSFAITRPADAKLRVTDIARDVPGVVFATSQNEMSAFVPFDPEAMGELRSGDRLMRLFRAAARSGATSAFVAMPDGKVSVLQFANIRGALSTIDVNVLDGIRYDSASPSEATSIATSNEDVPNIGASFFSREGQGSNRLALSGISSEDLVGVVSKFVEEFPGSKVVVLENESDQNTPQSLLGAIESADAAGDVAGAFHEGVTYLFRDSVRDVEHAQHTILHEGVHDGLSRLGVSVDVLKNVAANNPKLHAEALKIKSKYGYAYARAIEEAMADMGEKARSLNGWRRVLSAVRAKLRSLGLVKEWSDSDIEALALKALSRLKTPKETTVQRVGENQADELLAMFDAEDTINIEPAKWSEEDIDEAETKFLSDAPAGATIYRHNAELLKRVRRSSEIATNDLRGTPRTSRVVESPLAGFSGYEVSGEVVAPDETFNPGGALKVKVFGKEQVQAGLTQEPALTFTVMPDGELMVNGPFPDGDTFKDFEKRGWAKTAKGAGGEEQAGWSALKNPSNPNKPLPVSQVLPLLADVHARVREWRGEDYVGLYWSRSTGALGGLSDALGNHPTWTYFSRTSEITADAAPLFSRGSGVGMAVRDLKAVRDRVAERMTNLPAIHVLEEPGQAPKALRDHIEKAGAWGDVEGAMHDGEIYLFASGMANEERAEFVLATHEITHYGLRGKYGMGLDSVLQHIWLNNSLVRKSATALRAKNGLASNLEAVEEVLADMPSAELVKLKGWRKMVQAVRDWFADHGFDALAKKLNGWLNSGANEQQQADLFVADVIRQARGWVEHGKRQSGKYGTGTRLANTVGVFSRSAMKSVGANIDRGLKSLAKAITGKTTVHRAMFRAGLGWVDFVWGDVGEILPSGRTKGGKGLSHIVEARMRKDGLSEKEAVDVLTEMVRTIASGKEFDRKVFADVVRVGLRHNGYIAWLAKQPGSNGWVVTGYEIDPDRTAAGRATAAPTMSAASRTRDGEGAGSDGNMPRLSRSGNTSAAEQRADEIISKRVTTSRPVDAVVRVLTKTVRIDRATTFLYDKAGALLDRYAPEHIKAGIVSDYGIPEAVIDRRVQMQGSMKQQIRGAGELIDKLATLTRAESRIAYEWMNNNNPQAATHFEAQLPPESLKVMNEVKALIDKLSQEAVKLGQLDPEAFKRNRFEYLRRSYVKHTAELTSSEEQKRGRAISILGDQYKGRGMSEAVTMAKVKNIAPDWWGRKLQTGKADKGIKGERFVRLERRAATDEGSRPLVEQHGARMNEVFTKGRLLEVTYWPAGEAIPEKLSAWDKAGVWEVRDTKGGDLILWRDFTKQEREAMGEIDEARYAIAKTLHGMIHDVETGKYLEWLASKYAAKDSSAVTGSLVEASDRMRDTFGKDEWVQVPDTKIPGTSVKKYGLLSGRYLPGTIWNDVRQTVGFRFQPFGETYAAILGAWKTSKTALSPAVHANNVMANFVMADWHDVSAGHVLKALRLILAANDRDGKGLLGRAGNAASKVGIADREAAKIVLNRFSDSGGNIGTWATAELQKEQLEPLLKALEAEIAALGQSQPAQIGIMVALQKLLQLRFPSAWAAFKPTRIGTALTTEASNMLSLYEAEDQVFRVAAWLRAKEDGATDLEAGKVARKSFLDYNINAPWIQAARKTAFPFIAFTYRAVPMLLETAAKKPWKLLKLGVLAGGLNMLGYMLSGGDEEDERKYLPDEKKGRVLGVVPKLIRMPWNDVNGSPVFLDVRRFVPVGDILDSGQSHSAIPLIPSMVPGGVLSIFSEIISNRSQFTGRDITLDTDTPIEKAGKVIDHLYKAFAPNLIILPGTYAFEGVMNAGKGKTDTFGREQSTAAAVASAFGVKLGSYPTDVLRQSAWRQTQAQTMEIDRNITQLKRERQRNGIDQDEFQDKVNVQMDKKRAIMEKFRNSGS